MTKGFGRAVLAASLILSRAAESQPADDKPTADEALEEAKDLFRQGNELRKSGDCGAALVLYLRSRARVASAANTMNAAYCLHQQAREDEALDLYEELVARFASALSDSDRVSIAPAMAELRQKLGTVEVSANVEGAIVIDGRMRGRLPLLAPIRVRSGEHTLRIIKDGFQTYEQRLVIEPRKMVLVDATLVPLLLAGRLHIECPELLGADVFVDGAKLGSCPFDGALGPGSHLFWTRLGARGSNPVRVEVVLGQTTKVAASAADLGPELRVTTVPPSATLSIDGVSLGASTFQGPLTVGEHRLEANEAGYLPARIVVAGGQGGERQLTLEPDPAHPRWAQSKRSPAPGWFSIAADTAVVVQATVGGDAVSACGEGCAADVPIGARGLLRGAWTSRVGVGVGVDLGYQFVQIAHSARAIALNPVGRPQIQDQGRIDERLRWSAFLVGATTYYRSRGDWPWQVGASVGLSIGRVFAFREGQFENSLGSAFSAAQESTSSATYVYVMPETRIGRSLGHGLELSLGISLMTQLAVSEPVWENIDIVPTSASPGSSGDGGATFATESLLGHVVFGAAPTLALRWQIE